MTSAVSTEPSSPKLLIRKLERRKFGKLCYFKILENIQKVTVKRKASSKTCTGPKLGKRLSSETLIAV